MPPANSSLCTGSTSSSGCARNTHSESLGIASAYSVPGRVASSTCGKFHTFRSTMLGMACSCGGSGFLHPVCDPTSQSWLQDLDRNHVSLQTQQEMIRALSV